MCANTPDGSKNVPYEIKTSDHLLSFKVSTIILRQKLTKIGSRKVKLTQYRVAL